ncbi:hypothetical protein PENSPDRAFT_688266 [Peniophora sp. CONT]|nr:hypothetical protein PENSPDRAFT_688266 [Peniophora sp. CONT]
MQNVFSALRRQTAGPVPRALSLGAKRNRGDLPIADTAGVTSSALVSTSADHLTVPSLFIPAAVVSGVVKKSLKLGPRIRNRAVIAKEILVLSLQALFESADAFPPLKSAVGGLLFLTTQVELVSGNQEQIADIYAQIDAFAASLESAIPDATTLSSAHEAAILALAQDIGAVCVEAEMIAHQRPFMRFVRAKRHSAVSGRLMKKLDRANESFMRTMLASTEVKTSGILVCAQLLREEVHGVQASVQAVREGVHRLTRIANYIFAAQVLNVKP